MIKSSPPRQLRHAVRHSRAAGLGPRAQLKGECDEKRAGQDRKSSDPEHERERAGARKKREQHAQGDRGDPAQRQQSFTFDNVA